jgi:hypothetical protein
MIGTKSASRLLLALSLIAFAPGCIAFIERGTRGGKISPLASSNVQRGDKRSDVITKIGEPDETTVTPNPDGSGTIENMTYRAVDGYYVIVFGKVDYTTLRVALVNGVVENVSAYASGRDTLVLTGYNAMSVEPLHN